MKIVLKILLFPVALVIDLFTWVAVGVLSCSSFVFALAGSLLSVLAFAVMLTCSVTNGAILLGFMNVRFINVCADDVCVIAFCETRC